jgi:phosphoribosylformylglycinamidine synthase I
MKIGIIIFPGSNCDHDMLHVLQNVCNANVIELWHKNTDLQNVDVIILPGGFSYGDYLRCGAMASHSPIMQSVKKFAHEGGKVFGVCNGFQILCESGLLPGTLLRNNKQKFICDNVYLKVCTSNSIISNQYTKDEIIKVPIAHGEGRYYADEATIKNLVDNDQIILKYCSTKGIENDESNPNGSLLNIAGICNNTRNVFGMMPHPERCAEIELGNNDGLRFFESLLR